MKWQISHGVGGGKENFWIYLLTSDKWAIFNCLLDWCMSSRFWRGGHCRSIFTPVGVVFCSAVFRLACAYFCRHACGRNQLLLPFLLHSFNCVCVRARARPRAIVCVPLKSCSCKRRTERLLRFPKTFLPLGERGSPHCPSSCGSLPLLLSLCSNAPALVISDTWRGGQGRASRWNLQGLSVGKERWAARKTLEVGLFIFLAGQGSQTDRNRGRCFSDWIKMEGTQADFKK